LEVVRSNDPEPILDIHEATYRNQGITPPLSPDQIVNLSRLFEDVSSFYYIFDDDNRAIAGRYVFYGEPYTYDILAAKNLNSENEGTYLVYKILLDLHDKGAGLDMLGINIQRFADFKERFKGETVPYYLVKYDRNLITRIVYGLIRGYHR
jgi:hypothetical protein